MNRNDIKETFYKRYSASDSYLHFTFAGILCELLGCGDINGAPFLSCRLSMGIKMLARRLGGNIITVQDTASDSKFTYTAANPQELYSGRNRGIAEIARKFNGQGAEILYQSTMPDFINSDAEFYTALTQSLIKTNGIYADRLYAAEIAARNEYLPLYSALSCSKSGCAVFISELAPKNYPLNLSGYKIISAYCTEKDIDRNNKIQRAFRQITDKFPDVRSLSEVRREHIPAVTDRNAAGYIFHLAGENERIASAFGSLSARDIRGLFTEMNISEKSMERFWSLGDEHIFLAKCAQKTDGVAAVRCNKYGITAVTRDDMIDYAVNMICEEFENNIGYQPTFCISDVL